MQSEGVVLSFNNNLAKSSFNILLHTKTIWNVAAAIAENWSCRNFTTAKKLDHINKTPGIEVRVFLLMERLFWKDVCQSAKRPPVARMNHQSRFSFCCLLYVFFRKADSAIEENMLKTEHQPSIHKQSV